MDRLTVLTFGIAALVIGLGQQVDTAVCLQGARLLFTEVISLAHWLLQWLA